MVRVLRSAARALWVLGAGFWYIVVQIVLGGRSHVVQLTSNLFVIVERGINPNTVVYRSDQYGWIVTDPGVQVLSRGKNRALQALLRSKAGTPQTIRAIMLTHTHPDHYGNLPFFQQHGDPESRVYASESGWETVIHPEAFIRRQDAIAHAGQGKFPMSWFARLFIWTYPVYMWVIYGRGLVQLKELSRQQRLHPLEPQVRMDGSHRITVVPLPGHSPDEMLFFVEHPATGARIAIVGDLIPPQHVAMRELVPALYLPEGNPLDALNSLRRLQELHPTALVPTHTPPIVGSEVVDARLTELIARTESLIASIQFLWKRYPTWSAFAIGKRAFAQNGITRTHALGETEMGSWAAAIRRVDPKLASLREPS